MITLNRTQASIDKPLNDARNKAKAQVNEQIGEKRATFITSIPGQEMIYSAKELEAQAFLAESPTPTDLTPYPFLENEVGITAATATDLANLWISMAQQWRYVGSKLEQLRLGTQAQLDAATSIAEVDTIMDNLEATLTGISAA